MTAVTRVLTNALVWLLALVGLASACVWGATRLGVVEPLVVFVALRRLRGLGRRGRSIAASVRGRLVCAAPLPASERDACDDGARDDGAEREEPHEPVRAGVRRQRERLGPVELHVCGLEILDAAALAELGAEGVAPVGGDVARARRERLARAAARALELGEDAPLVVVADVEHAAAVHLRAGERARGERRGGGGDGERAEEGAARVQARRLHGAGITAGVVRVVGGGGARVGESA